MDKFEVIVRFDFFDGGFECCRYIVTSVDSAHATAMAKILTIEKFEGRDGMVNVERVMRVE